MEQTETGTEAAGAWLIVVDGREYRVDAAAAGRPDLLSVIVGGRQATVNVRALGNGAYAALGVELRVIDPRSRDFAATAEPTDGGAFEAAARMPGRVTAVLAAEGDDVAAGQGVVVLEAMKMENEIQSEIDGRLDRLLVEVGQTVDGGDPLFVVTPTADGAASAQASDRAASREG